VVASSSTMWHVDVRSRHPAMSATNISSTDDDVAPIDFPYLTATLTVNIFQSVTLFDELFASLEILRHALHDHAIFIEFWDFLIFSLSLSAGAILSVLSCLYEF
jgi:hypothetical protein